MSPFLSSPPPSSPHVKCWLHVCFLEETTSFCTLISYFFSFTTLAWRCKSCHDQKRSAISSTRGSRPAGRGSSGCLHCPYPVAVPLYFWRNHVKEKRHQILSGQRRSCPPPRGFNRGKRRRAMKGILRPKVKTSPQTNCLMLSRLPYEVRQLIWRQCLGGDSIHLSKKHDAFTCFLFF